MKTNITPAALSALSRGDMENFVAASTPGGIEAQEKRGQIAQSFLETLPIEGTSKPEERKAFEALGFKFGQPADKLFVNVTFPNGWRKKATDHAMNSELLDDKGRVRGNIFYKAAFYDQRADVHLTCRFGVRSTYGSEDRTVYIEDACGQIDKKITGLKAADWNNREEAQKRYDKEKSASAELHAWLDEKYPDWKSAAAYWD